MGGRRRMSLALVIGSVVLSLALPAAMVAHALLLSSDPAAGSTVGSAPSAIRLTFGETPDPKLSTVKVLDTAGRDHVSGPIEPAAGSPQELSVPVGALGDGVYTVSWRTLSSVDGHVAAGSFAFGVGVAVPAASPGETPANGISTPSASPEATIARWLLYAGLIALVGVAFAIAVLRLAPSPELLRVAAAGWIAAMLGSIGVVAIQWLDADSDFGTILGTSIGAWGIARFAVAAATGVAIAVAWRSAARRRTALMTGGAGATVAMAVDVLAGHAAAGAGWPLQAAFQWLHVMAVGIWIGGLGALLVSIRGAPSAAKAAATRAFSTWAGVALGVVAVTGVIRAVVEVGTLDALITTDFGLVVIAKSVLLAFLAVLGAANRFINVPAAVRALAGLRRVGVAELGLATVVLVLSAVLVNLAPPASSAGQQQPAAPPIISVGSDFGTSVKVRMVVAPGRAGFNDFAAAVTDFDTGQPADATAVTLRFDLASATGVGSSRLDLSRSGPGAFAASGGNLSIDGIWKIVATVTGPTGSVEVPLLAATVIPSQAIDVNASPGTPTIYSIHLASGGSVQVYLDPGAAGANDVHATFFDAAGNENPVPSATMALFPAGGPGILLSPRQLEPGHFVASTTLESGNVTLDVLGSDTGAGPIHIHVTIPVQ